MAQVDKNLHEFVDLLCNYTYYCTVGDDGRIYTMNDDAAPDELIKMKINDKAHTVSAYTDDCKYNDIILNPFNESLKLSAENKWFYRKLNTGLFATFQFCVGGIINAALSEEGSAALDYIPKKLNKIDQKTLEAFKTVFDSKRNETRQLCMIRYDRNTYTARLETSIFDDSFWDAVHFKKMRKRDKELIIKLAEVFFGTTDVKKQFTFTSDDKKAPRADAFLNVLHQIYNQCDTILQSVMDIDLQVDVFGEYLAMFPDFIKASKWMSSFAIDNADKETTKEKTKAATKATKAISSIAIGMNGRSANNRRSRERTSGNVIIPGSGTTRRASRYEDDRYDDRYDDDDRYYNSRSSSRRRSERDAGRRGYSTRSDRYDDRRSDRGGLYERRSSRSSRRSFPVM